jgi:diaminopimelate decarboxylase
MNNGWQIEGFLETSEGHLTIDGVDSTALAAEFGTPLFVFSESRIHQNIARLKEAGNAVDCGFKVCYAAKANSNMAILRAVRESGGDLEVNSGGELWKALKAGFSGEQIIFNGTSKEIWEIEMAVNSEIYAIQVDSPYELEMIAAVARRLERAARVSLRLVPEIESKTHSGLQTAMVTSKFGMMPDQAIDAIRRFADDSYVDICGIHLHIGSQNSSAEHYTDAMRALFENVDRIFESTGRRMRHINLGGGFPVDYLRDRSHIEDFADAEKTMLSANYEPADAILAAWTAIRNAAAAEQKSHLVDGLTLLIEPGRSVIGDAGVCLTTVRSRKTRPAAGSDDVWLLTDAGFNILLSMETYKWYYHLIAAERAGAAHDRRYKLAGPLCDGGDVYFDVEGHHRLPEYRLLPADVCPNEVLALLNCGAYSVAQMFQYNGRFLPAIVMTKTDGSYELIRRRDSFEDLIANDIW